MPSVLRLSAWQKSNSPLITAGKLGRTSGVVEGVSSVEAACGVVVSIVNFGVGTGAAEAPWPVILLGDAILPATAEAATTAIQKNE